MKKKVAKRRKRSFDDFVESLMDQDDFTNGDVLTDHQQLVDNFSRWRFLQGLLEGSINPAHVNQVIPFVLASYLIRNQEGYEDPALMNHDDSDVPAGFENIPAASGPSSARDGAGAGMFSLDQMKRGDEESKPPYTEKNLAIIKDLLLKKQQRQNNGKMGVTAVGRRCGPPPEGNDKSCLEDIERLLPDQDEQPEAHQFAWDVLIALYGLGITKVEQRENSPAWRARNVVTRFLIFYDFINKGIIPDALDKILSDPTNNIPPIPSTAP